MSNKTLANVWFLALLFALPSARGASAGPERVSLYGYMPEAVARLTPGGRLPATRSLSLAIGLPLRNQAVLDELLRQIYDPQSANFHKFLGPPEFTARFGPTEQDYQAVIRFAEANGLAVTGTHANRLVLDVEGSVSSIEQAFQVTLRTYRHPREARDFFAPDTEPSVPANLPVADMWGLTDYGLPRPLSHRIDPSKVTPFNFNGSGPGGSYQGGDFRHAYVPGAGLTGSGQIAAVAEFDGYYANDITSYENDCGYSHVPLQNVLLDGVTGTPGYSGVAGAVSEASLDIELIIAMAPGLSTLIVYEGSSPYDVFNRIVTDNSAKQVSCSWSWSVGPAHTWGRPGTKTLDSQLQEMAAQGQSFFQASGDSDAYTGNQALSSSSGPIPVDSIFVTSVGGTTLNMNGAGASWSSETVWNWGDNTGSGGGVSPNYAIPAWQAHVDMAANGGSTVNRNIPDVAMTADAVHVVYSNGVSGTFGGTSCAAPLWAGFCALVNQQSIAVGGTNIGFLNPALYAIGAGSNYTKCFHDITTGNNIGTNTPGFFNAVTNYDLCTGLGTPNGTNLIDALVPLASSYSIAWTNPAPITYGTALSSVQLNATAGVPGSFAYSPTNGAVLNTGANTLSVIFTPADTIDYSSTADSVSLAVLPAPLIVTAANASRAYGQANPVFTGAIAGVTNGDNITATYSCSATAASPAGTYPIIPSLLDPDNLQTNYQVTLVDGTLTVTLAAPPTIISVTCDTGLTNGGTTVTILGTGFAPGATVNFGALPASLVDVISSTNITVVTPACAPGTVNIVLANADGLNATLTNAFTYVAPSGAPPSIVSQPANQVVGLGQIAAFGVTATGTAPLSYQWQLNGANLTDNGRFTGSQSNTLALAGVALGDAGNYQAIVTNAYGSATSAVATLAIVAPSVLRVVTQTDGTITLAWGATAGQTYQVQYKTNLAQPDWSNLCVVTATNSTAIAFDAVNRSGQCVYRTVWLP